MIRMILPFALILALLTGCAEDEADFGGRQADGADEPVALSIAPESVTRTVTFEGDAWEGGEEVAVSIGGTVKKYVVGTDKTTLSPATDVEPFYWTGATMDIEAWYPYADEKPTVTVPADQTTMTKVCEAIMLEASVTDAPLGPVALTFTHRTARIFLKPLRCSGIHSDYSSDAAYLTNLSGVSSGTTIRPYKFANIGYYALVAPQDIADGTSIATICYSGDMFTYKPGATTFAAGVDYDFDVSYYFNTRPKLNGHKYVEMGDGLKWATCNLGAANPMDYGNYYAWGETATKSTYDWDTYAFNPSGDGNTFTKYTTSDAQLDASDDAARQNWGGTWRMPTRAEMEALTNTTNFTWTWTTDYLGTGVAGMIVTSKVSGFVGNSIFLPAAGYINNTGVGMAGSLGDYWASNIYITIIFSGTKLLIKSDGASVSGSQRRSGYSVRPVSN